MARRVVNPILFICDLQEKFRPAIHEFAKVVSTTDKMLKASQILNFPIIATTQNRARLGETVPELKLDAPDGFKTLLHADKTAFSMYTPAVASALSTYRSTTSPLATSHTCVIVGIESHICVTQTSLDLLKAGHKVYVLADGVSSCNKEEVPIALARLRSEGVVVTTSEGFLYEVMGDAKIDEFRSVVKLVTGSKDATREALQSLCGKL